MKTVIRLVAIAAVIFVIDLFWLNLIGGAYASAVEKIQGGRPMVARIIPAIVVYGALAILVNRAESVRDAALIGSATYAVYDFTVATIFKDYPIWIGVADTVWGGALFGMSKYIVDRYFD
jgi:uncharacterized membrane protein